MPWHTSVKQPSHRTQAYYGSAFGMGQLSGSIYLNHVAIYAIEAPAYAASGFLIDRIGRRPVFVYALAECETSAAQCKMHQPWPSACCTDDGAVCRCDAFTVHLPALNPSTAAQCMCFDSSNWKQVKQAILACRRRHVSGVRVHARLAAAAAGHQLEVWRCHGLQPGVHLHRGDVPHHSPQHSAGEAAGRAQGHDEDAKHWSYLHCVLHWSLSRCISSGDLS